MKMKKAGSMFILSAIKKACGTTERTVIPQAFI
jgi:hypothetical protein